MKMEDYATKERQAFVNGEAPTNEQKFARAKQQLGTHYLLHPVNRVQRCVKAAGELEQFNLAQFKARSERGLE